MPAGKVTVPDVLSGNAAEIWRSAFLSAYDGTCKEGGEKGDRDSCSAAVAWAAVKKSYKKSESGGWIAKTFSEEMIDTIIGNSDEDETIEVAGVEKGGGAMSDILQRSSIGEGYAPIVLRGLTRDSHQELIDAGYGDHMAQRPDWISSAAWVKLPLKERTVGAMLRRSDEAEAYQMAFKNTIEAGWEAKPNPTRPEEMIFKKWVDNLGGLIMVRAILVRKSHNLDWYIKEISRGHQGSLAVRVAPDEARYHDPFK